MASPKLPSPLRDAGVVRVLDGPGGAHVGMGILVGPRHVLTCAHVVNEAMHRQQMAAAEPHPSAAVHMELPQVGGSPPIRGKGVVRWLAPSQHQSGDLALIELDAAAPDAAGVAVLADVKGMNVVDDRLSVFGYRGGNQVGAHARATFQGQAGTARMQIDSVGVAGGFVAAGYSGAAIWDLDQDAVVGMASDLDTGSEHPIAYAIPVSEISDFLADLPIERRRLFPSFGAAWSTLSVAVLFILVLHVVHIQTKTGLGTLLFFAPTQPIAKLTGAVLFALLAPFLFWLLLLHARSMRLHRWWQRVPALSWRGWSRALWNRSGGAILFLLLFVVAPLYAQGYFIDQLHEDDVKVSVNPDKFGYDHLNLPAGEGWYCATAPGVIKCTKPGMGLYALLEPRQGAVVNFFDNAYSLGGADLVPSTTFWPILEPVAIYVLTGIATILAALSLWTIFYRVPPYAGPKESQATGTPAGS